ncbi:MAG: hypothetical protein WBF93_14260, partial [Pirellulales bacterium]
MEGRELLAGNVIAAFANGNLTLRGDHASNEIRIGMTGADLVVEGQAGTTINGGATDFVVAVGSNTIPGNLSASLRQGNDSLLLDGVHVSGSTTIKSARGADTIEIRGNSELDGNVNIRTGRDNDVVFIHDNSTGIDGNLAIRGKKGQDTIGLADSVFNGNVDIRGNWANDGVAAFDNIFNGSY